MFCCRAKTIVTIVQQSNPRLNLTQTRTSLYNRYRHGPQKISNPETTFLDFLKKSFLTESGRKDLKDDALHMLKWPFKMEFNKMKVIDKTVIFEHFDSDEAIKRWRPVCDRDSLNGYSTSHFSRSPNGHALFHGVIDNTLPDDGLTANAGFSAVIGPPRRRDHPFKMEPQWNWSQYNCLEMKLRGDGRKYAIVLGHGTHAEDIGYYDNFAYPIHTRGGPFWQTIRIPFSKFIYNYRDYVQDRQSYLPAFAITFVSFVIHDKVDGPFALEIDYIGLRKEHRIIQEQSSYEMYRIKHLRFRPVHVESPPPLVD